MATKHKKEESLRLALEVADSEIRLRKMQLLNAPPVIANRRKKRMKKLQLDLADDETAQSLLPQARHFALMRDAREESWKKMFGGQLKQALEDLTYFYESNGNTCLKQEVFDAPFEQEEDNGRWQELRSVLDKAEGRKEITEAFLDLIRSMWVSYLEAEIPPLPKF